MVIGNGCGKLKCIVSTLLNGKTKDIPNAQIVVKSLGFIVRNQIKYFELKNTAIVNGSNSASK